MAGSLLLMLAMVGARLLSWSRGRVWRFGCAVLFGVNSRVGGHCFHALDTSHLFGFRPICLAISGISSIHLSSLRGPRDAPRPLIVHQRRVVNSDLRPPTEPPPATSRSRLEDSART